MISRKYNNKANATGQFIKKLRQAKRMSRDSLSAKLMLLGIDINRDGIYRIEIGKRILKDFELSAISIVLNCSEADMLKECKEELIKNGSLIK